MRFFRIPQDKCRHSFEFVSFVTEAVYKCRWCGKYAMNCYSAASKEAS